MKKWMLTGLALILVLALFSADVSAQGITNRGKYWILGWAFNNQAVEDSFYIVLCTDDHTPTTATNTLSQLTQIAGGNGYEFGGGDGANEGGIAKGTSFNAWVEGDADSTAHVQIRDVVWTAAGGSIPSSGEGARWAVMTDNNATMGSRLIYAWWDLSSARSVSTGQTLTLEALKLKLTTP